MIENDNTKQNEVKDNVPYQFTASPLNLLYVLDSDCLKMLNLLIQEESFWRSKKKLVDGYFFKSLNDLKEDMFMGNDQDVRLTLEALYINGLIDIINQGKQMKASGFKINFKMIIEIDKQSILHVKKFSPRICKLKRNTKCSYLLKGKEEVSSVVQINAEASTNCSPDCTPKLDNIDNSDKINNKDKIENNDKIKTNIIVDIIKVETQMEKDSNNPKLTSKGIIDDSKGKQEIDVPATKTAAQATAQTKNNVINGDRLVIKLNQDFNRLGKEVFYQSLYNSYSVMELKNIRCRIPTLEIGLTDNDKDYMKYHTTCAIRKKEAN